MCIALTKAKKWNVWTVISLLIESKVMNLDSSLSLALVIASHLVLMKRIRYAVPALSTKESLFNDCKEEKSGKGLFLLLLVGSWADKLLAKSDVFLCIWEIMQNELHCLVWLHRYVQQLTFKRTFGLSFYFKWDILLSSESVLAPLPYLKDTIITVLTISNERNFWCLHRPGHEVPSSL